MHFNFHLSGDESPEQSRRIANAVLALGGLTTDTQVGKLTVGIDIDPELSDEERAERKAKYDEFGGTITLAERKPTLSRFVGGIADPTAHSAGEEDEPTSEVVGGPLAMEVMKAGLSDIQREILRNPPEHCPADTAVVDILAPNLATIVPPPVPTTSAVTPSGLDAKGLPWDERIHSSSRAINADGTWRYRKNVPDETKRDVEAELRGLIDGLVKAVTDILPPNSDFSHGGIVTVPPPVPMSGPEYVLAGVGLVDESALKDSNTVVSPPTPPAPPVPTGALERTYSDVVNLIMARKVQPDTYVAILGMSLPEFAKHVISAPNDATLMFDALDAASRS